MYPSAAGSARRLGAAADDAGGRKVPSGPVSRVLSRTVIYLGAHVAVRLLARYPGAGRADP